MPNNPFRHKAGYVKVASGLTKAKRKDVITSLRVTNRVFQAAGQELGSPNGGPSPTFGGSTSTGGGSVGAGGESGSGYFGNALP